MYLTYLTIYSLRDMNTQLGLNCAHTRSVDLVSLVTPDQPTTEDIEIHMMSSVTDGNRLEDEDTPVELIEIFVQ